MFYGRFLLTSLFQKEPLQLNAKRLGSFIQKYSEFMEVQLLKLISFRRQTNLNIFEIVRAIFRRPVYSKNTAYSGKGLTWKMGKIEGFF